MPARSTENIQLTASTDGSAMNVWAPTEREKVVVYASSIHCDRMRGDGAQRAMGMENMRTHVEERVLLGWGRQPECEKHQ